MKPIHLVVTLLAGCVVYLIQDRIVTGTSKHIDAIEQAKSDGVGIVVYASMVLPETVQVEVKPEAPKPSAVHAVKPEDKVVAKPQSVPSTTPLKVQPVSNAKPKAVAPAVPQPVVPKPTSTVNQPMMKVCNGGQCQLVPMPISQSDTTINNSYDQTQYRRKWKRR